MGRIVLCADTESLIRPMLLGLENISLEDKSWLVSIPDAVYARAFISRSSDIDEVWVVSSDQMNAIDLVCAIRKDRADIDVFLVAPEEPSLMGNYAEKLGVKGVWSVDDFRDRFDKEIRRRFAMKEIASLNIEQGQTKELEVEHSSKCSEVVQNENQVVNTSHENNQATNKLNISKPDKRNATATPAIRPDKGCFTVSLFSGSGGVGKSSFIAIASCITQSKGFKTAVIDADTQFGDMAQMLTGAKKVPLEDVLEDPTKLEKESLDTTGEYPFVLQAPRRLEASEGLVGNISKAVVLCSKVFDVIYVDTSASFSDDHVWLLENSDCSMFMMEQRASSVRSVQHAVDLCKRMGIATGSYIYALNRCSKEAIFSAVDIAHVMQGANIVEFKDGESEIEEYLGSGMALEAASLNNDFVSSVGEVLDGILPTSAFFSGSPEWSLPSDDGRIRLRGRDTHKSFTPERREKKRRASRRSCQNASLDSTAPINDKSRL